MGGRGVGPTPRSTVSGREEDEDRPSPPNGALVVLGSSSRLGEDRLDDLDFEEVSEEKKVSLEQLV